MNASKTNIEVSTLLLTEDPKVPGLSEKKFSRNGFNPSKQNRPTSLIQYAAENIIQRN
jgi:hypothetical protein